MTVLCVALGAAVGAPLRFLVDGAVRRHVTTVFPLGTLVVNVLACALLGAVAGFGAGLSSPTGALLGTGFAATLSTYSTLGWETVTLVEDGRWRVAVGYVAASVIAGVAAALLVRG